jgi:hypothetical protein
MSNPPPGLIAADAVAELLTHNVNNDATGGVWRVTGADGTGRILKIAVPPRNPPRPRVWPTSNDPRHWNFWQRETLAYRDELTATAYPGIGAPRLLDEIELDDGSTALWLEDVDGTAGAAWTIHQYADFATRLGAAQAAWIDRPQPPWCSRGWLRQYLATWSIPETVDWDDAFVARVWPAPLRAGLADVWARRAKLLDRVESFPRTLAHLDVWPTNLIWSAGGPVLLDWAFVGDGAVGEDIGNLVFDAFADGLVPISALDELTEAVTDGYIAGSGRPADEIRTAIAASVAAKYAWFGPMRVDRVVHEGTAGSASYDVGGSPEELFARWRPLVEQLVHYADQALSA